MRLNLGKFEYNNKSGFILKPEVMRRVHVNKKTIRPFCRILTRRYHTCNCKCASNQHLSILQTQ
jgi:hypothetical protein